MSEAEFDSYLSLLAKFLRLRSRQRADLADELRDHLDSRLEELLAAGKTRDEAIAVALEEFGDAAVLATEFSRLASRRTRKFVMRCTAASAAVVAAVVLLSVALAPPGPNGVGPRNVVAQGEAGLPGGAAPGGAPGPGGVPAVTEKASVEQQAIAALDEKLGKVVQAEFPGVPLREVLTSVADSIEVDLLIDEVALTDAGISVDDPVTLRLTRTPTSARTILDFILEPYDLSFVNRSGVVFVTTAEMADELLIAKVYNVRDLLENATSHAVMEWGPPAGGAGGGGEFGGGGGGGGFFSVTDASLAAAMSAAAGQSGPAPEGEAKPAADGEDDHAAERAAKLNPPDQWNRRVIGPAAELIHTIQQTAGGLWADLDGAGGTMTPFNGMLIIRQTEPVHGEIQKLLDALREAGRQQPGGSVEVPKGDAQPDTPVGGSPLGPIGPEDGVVPAAPTAGPTPAAASPKGLGTRFADYRPTAEMRQMFLSLLNETGFSTGEIGDVTMLEAILAVRGPAQGVFFQAGVTSNNVRTLRQQHFAAQTPIADLYALFDAAQAEAKRDGLDTIDSGHLLVALLETNGQGTLRELLAQMGVNPEQMRDRVREYRKAAPPEDRNPLQTGAEGGPGAGPEEAERSSAWRDLGFRVADLSEEEKGSATEGTRYRGGLKVTEIRADGPAARADIRVGDVLVGLHQWETVDLDNVEWALKNLPRGESAVVRYYVIRDRETRVGELKLVSR